MVGIEQVCLAGLEAKQGTVRRVGLNGTCGESGKERTLCKWVFSYTLLPGWLYQALTLVTDTVCGHETGRLVGQCGSETLDFDLVVGIRVLDDQVPYSGNCQAESGLLLGLIWPSFCVGSKEVSTYDGSEGNLTSATNKWPGDSSDQMSAGYVFVGDFSGAHALYCPTLVIRGQPLCYCSKG